MSIIFGNKPAPELHCPNCGTLMLYSEGLDGVGDVEEKDMEPFGQYDCPECGLVVDNDNRDFPAISIA